MSTPPDAPARAAAAIPQISAAAAAGRMVAQGLLAEDEILPALAAHAPAGAAGLVRERFHLAHRAGLAERAQAAFRVRAALVPLIAARAPRPHLAAAARAADPKGALLPRERAGLTLEAVAAALALATHRGAHHGRGRRR